MKVESFILSNEDSIESFFYKARVFGIKSNFEGYQIVNIINKALDYNFEACPDMTLTMKFSNASINGNVDLFSDAEESFLVYKNNLHPCVTEMYLYQNKTNDYYLLDSYQQYTYILLIYYDEMLLYPNDILDVLQQVKAWNAIEEINISDTKQFVNLLF
jgi:hypothetical protein